jgi:hypothetical protein
MATTSNSSSSNASSTLHLANCNAITMQQGVVEVTPACHLLIRGKRILYVGSSAPPPPPSQVTLLISFNTHPLPQHNSLLNIFTRNCNSF